MNPLCLTDAGSPSALIFLSPIEFFVLIFLSPSCPYLELRLSDFADDHVHAMPSVIPCCALVSLESTQISSVGLAYVLIFHACQNGALYSL